eukprot:9411349-Alexandrium_andersonii.AAC.1
MCAVALQRLRPCAGMLARAFHVSRLVGAGCAGQCLAVSVAIQRAQAARDPRAGERLASCASFGPRAERPMACEGGADAE